MARGWRDGVKAGMWVNLSPLVSDLVILKYISWASKGDDGEYGISGGRLFVL